MGTALIIIGIPTIMYFIAGLSKKWIGIICSIGFILLTLLATFQPYRLDRINSGMTLGLALKKMVIK